MVPKKTPDSTMGDVYAQYEPEPTLKRLIGKSSLLADIFIPEKIAACQKLVDDARNNFFSTSWADMDVLDALVKNESLAEDYPELCTRIFQPLSNIKGQADAFGFSLVARLSNYLLEYCESYSYSAQMTAKDQFIIGKLVEALRRAFQEKITDAGGAIEKELIAVIELIRRDQYYSVGHI